MVYLCGSYIVATIAVIISLFVVYVKWSFKYWKSKNIPYLQPSFPFGNFENPLRNKKAQSVCYKEFYDEFKKMGKTCGGIYTFLTPTFIPVDPEFNKHILVKNFQSFHARGLHINERDQPVSANIFNMDGEKWKILRSKLSPTFTSAKMKHMFHLMTACSSTMDKYIKPYVDNNMPVDVKDFVGRLTTDIIGSCAFGIECNSFEDTTFQHSLMRIFIESGSLFNVIFTNTLPSLARLLRVTTFPKKPTQIVVGSLEETMKMRKENNVNRNDFLQSLIEMEKKGLVNANEIMGTGLLFFLGGYETSATTMTFTLFELAWNQDLQTKLRNEITEVLYKHDNSLTFEAIQDMKYLQMVIDGKFGKLFKLQFPSIYIIGVQLTAVLP